MSENDLFKRTLDKTMALCSRREYCRNDIQNKLHKWGINNSDSDKIINILLDENFINESRYSTAFVRDKFLYNKWGRVKITAHLKTRNIPPDIIKTSLDSIDNETYIKTLKDLITRHRGSVKYKNQVMF